MKKLFICILVFNGFSFARYYGSDNSYSFEFSQKGLIKNPPESCDGHVDFEWRKGNAGFNIVGNLYLRGFLLMPIFLLLY